MYAKKIKAGIKQALIICSLVLLSACTFMYDEDGKSKDYLDPDLKKSYQDYKDQIFPPEVTGYSVNDDGSKKKKSKLSSKSNEPEIPEFSEILAAPVPPEAAPDKLVSISVTEDIPLKDVLVELSRLADVDMEIDPGITGGIILKVKNKPFSDVIDRVVSLGGLRKVVKDGTLRVERDLPYQMTYSVDFLNLVRSSTGNMAINTQVLGAAGASSGSGGLSSGSASSITSTYEGDLWKSIEDTITAILSYQTVSASSSTGTTSGDTLNLNRQANVITVFTTDKKHQYIKEYLDKVKQSVSAQVLIEAKIVEVTLDDQYRSGIDWGTIKDQNLGLKLTGNFVGGIGSTSDFITLSGGADSARTLDSAISFVQKFGTTRTLSSPRLHAMNNQQSVLTFAENNVYFTVNAEEETEQDGNNNDVTKLNITSTLNTVPIGVILTLQPSINLDTQEVTMNIRPTLSRITDSKQDPAVDLLVARQNSDNPISITSEIPVIEVREIDSVLKIKSGEVMVIGGLMKDAVVNNDSGVPYVSQIPFFGRAFKSTVKTNEIVETIIFIKATIVPSRGVSKADQNVYENFTRDPRPLAF